MFKSKSSKALLASIAALSFAVGYTGLAATGPSLLGTTAAFAQTHDDGTHEDGGGKGPKYQGGGQGGQGQGAQQDGDHGQGGQGGEDASKGPRAGGGGEDETESDGRGPQYGKPSGERGTKPVWAQEGIPEVELGRLNVIRSPNQVLDRALGEVIANFDPAASAALYSGTAANFETTIVANWDTVTYVDSPLENLALLKELWTTQSTSLPGVTPSNLIELSAIFIGSASDKTMPVSNLTVEALAKIVGVQMPQSVIDSIADKAEDVRAAIALAHG